MAQYINAVQAINEQMEDHYNIAMCDECCACSKLVPMKACHDFYRSGRVDRGYVHLPTFRMNQATRRMEAAKKRYAVNYPVWVAEQEARKEQLGL